MIRGFVKVVEKGWGREEWIENSPLYCAKLLHINRDKKCSLHYHEKKFETFHMLSGCVLLGLDGETYIFELGQIVDIRPYQEHMFMGINDCSVILEASTQHFESDSIRVEKGD